MDIDAKRFHGFVSPMVINGIIGREGYGDSAEYWLIRKAADRKMAVRDSSKEDDKAPYTLADVEEVKAKLDFSAKQRSQLIRQAVKLLPMRPVHISIATGIERRHVSGTLSDMRMRGYVRRLDDGRYEFVSDPKNQAVREVRKASISSTVALKSARVEKVDPWKAMQGETVEEFLARGGNIDYSGTAHKFERLTDKDISQAIKRRPTSYATTAGRSYLAI